MLLARSHFARSDGLSYTTKDGGIDKELLVLARRRLHARRPEPRTVVRNAPGVGPCAPSVTKWLVASFNNFCKGLSVASFMIASTFMRLVTSAKPSRDFRPT